MRVVVLVWEGFLGILTIALIVAALFSVSPGQYLVFILAQAGATGLVATGLALSFRTGTPNLAVGSIAAFTAMVTAWLMNMSGLGWSAAIIAILLTTVGGLLLGLFVTALSAPAWAVTLGAAVACEALVSGIADGRVIPVDIDFPTYVWFVLFVIVSLGGALAWPALRVASPWITAMLGLGGSSLLAALGGVALLTRTHAATPVAGWTTTTLTLAAVLLGGISVHGRRGGIAGTVLAVLFLTLVQGQLVLWATPVWVFQVIAGAVILAALLAGRLADLVTQETPAPVTPDARS
ncbi:ABC transporter permease subunit [Nonomuraea guangzhouensis]|uniref:Ribose/xylose/arabinose/galactoside ABC-type transport system, permease component n=1 Tax=Nonomuraea guangzhouensis TaxID=1291555 RepID=A0ABW4GFY9_9ACTN|nr:hypothetical protein [Nonomuraea guangzhouensis]